MPASQKTISGFLLLSSCVFILGACSTAKEIGDGISQGFGNMGRDISLMFEGHEEEKETQIVDMYDDRYYDSRYDQVATEMSDTSVQLYGLDGRTAKPRPDAREDMIVRGVGNADPSVTVYSLDNGQAQAQGFQPPQKPETYYDFQRQQNQEQQTTSRAMPSFVPMTRKQAQTGNNGQVNQFSTMPNRIYFGHDSKELTPAGQQVVTHVANGYQGQNLSVEGHASERAEQENSIERKVTNLKVSMDRALNVSRSLIYKGVPAESIETKAYGDTQPPLASQGMSPEAAARRVEIRAK